MDRLAFFLLVIFLASGCQPPQNKEQNKEEAAPVPVEFTISTRGDISTGILSTSTIDSEVKVDVYPKHSGPISLLRAEEGNFVQPGQLLAQIDSSEQELAYKQAQATLTEMSSNYKRLETMYKNKMTSQEAYDSAKFAYEKAKINEEIAKLSLDNTRILSPIRGLVIQRGIRFGERTTPASLAFSIIDLESRIVEVYVPETDITKIRPKLPVEIRTDSRPDQIFKGSVRKVSPSVDPRSGTVKVTIDPEDPEMLLRPGMFVRVYILCDTHKNTVLIPRSAVVPLDNKLAVYKIQPAPPEATPSAASESTPAAEKPAATPGSTTVPEKQSYAIAERVFFEAGYQNEFYIEALQGIQEGERIVHVGQQGLQPGAKIRIMNEPTAHQASVTAEDTALNTQKTSQ